MRCAAILLTLAAALIAMSGIANADTYCQQVGNQTYCSDGQIYERFGNTTYDRRGNYWQHYGNQTYGSDGTMYEKSGNQTYVNQGGAWQLFDSQTYDANPCKLIAKMVFCQ
jgi:hypothetical protein